VIGDLRFAINEVAYPLRLSSFTNHNIQPFATGDMRSAIEKAAWQFPPVSITNRKSPMSQDRLAASTTHEVD
jgi:hypothetical protein